MQTPTSNTGGPVSLSEPSCTLQTVIFYEDVNAGARALAIYQQLERQLRLELKMICRLWRFDMLDALPLKQAAANDMAEAQLIVFSAKASFLPNTLLRGLVEHWLAHVANWDCALAALIACSNPDPQQPILLREYLRERAHRHHLAFFYARYVPGATDAGLAASLAQPSWTSTQFEGGRRNGELGGLAGRWRGLEFPEAKLESHRSGSPAAG